MVWFRRTLTADEGVAHRYTASLVDPDDAAIGAANLVTLTITLYDEKTNEIINSRNEQNALNANGVTVADGAAGTVLTWQAEAADMPIVDDTLDSEVHIARFAFTYGPNAIPGAHEVAIRVKNRELSPGVV
jgi:hypothetical protein